jgi:hypothetical protein
VRSIAVRRIALLVALAACGAPPPASLSNHAPAPAPRQPAPLYAQLFAVKTTLRMAYEVRWPSPPERSTGFATCWIEPHPLSGGWASDVNCGSDTDDDGGVIADWLALKLTATEAGLWADRDSERDATRLDPADMLISATPYPISRVIHVPGPGDDQVEARRTVLPFQGGWCVHDDGPWARTYCFRDGLLVGASSTHAASAAVYVGTTPR